MKAIPGADRPEDAIKFIIEAAAAGRLKGVMVAMTFDDDAPIDFRITGENTRGDLAWVGAWFTKEALD